MAGKPCKKRVDSPPRYLGVRQRGERYIAQVKVDGEAIHLGTFNTAEAAAMAFDAWVKTHRGEGAKLNFPVAASTSATYALLIAEAVLHVFQKDAWLSGATQAQKRRIVAAVVPLLNRWSANPELSQEDKSETCVEAEDGTTRDGGAGAGRIEA